jgi:hypothetical protein
VKAGKGKQEEELKMDGGHSVFLKDMKIYSSDAME